MKHRKNFSRDHLQLIFSVILLSAGVSFLLALLLFPDISKGYNLAESVDMSRTVRHIEVLSSGEHAGRLSGSPGNRASLEYISREFSSIGLLPMGQENGYLQQFPAVVPHLDESPEFSITIPDSQEKIQFFLYEDYSVHSSFFSRSIDFSGDILICSRSLNSYPPQLLKNRLIIAPRPSYMIPSLETARAAGASGLFFTAAANWYGAREVNKPSEKQIAIHDKLAADFFSGDMNPAAVAEVKKLARGEEDPLLIPGASISVEMHFPVVSSANILGVLPGRSTRFNPGKGELEPEKGALIISADIDGRGRGPEGIHFPSASKQASSAALLVELARAAASAPVSPKRSIIFAGWNSSETDAAGARFFSRNSGINLEKSHIIHLQNLGTGGIQSSVVTDGRNAGILSSLFSQYGANRAVPVSRSTVDSSGSVVPFMNLNMPALIFKASASAPDGLQNNFASVDLHALEQRGKIAADYLEYELYEPPFLSLLPRSMLLTVTVLIILILIVRIVGRLSGMPGSRNVWENIYFHPLMSFIRHAGAYLLPASLAMFLFILIIQLPPDSQVNRSTGENNISFPLLMKMGWNFVLDFAGGNLRTSADSGTILGILFSSGLQSLKLIAGALGVSALVSFLAARRSVLGRNAFSPQRDSLSLGGILGASVPDIVVILAMLSLYVAFSKIHPELSRNLQLQQGFFPLISISILPAAYSARMTGLRMDRELQRSYILAARARGYSPGKIFRTQLLRPLAGSFGENLPSLMALILTNLILVEYLFNYKGLVFYLLYFYQRHDASSFISVSLALLVLYSLVSLIGGAMAMVFQPMKSRRLV